MSSYDQDRKTMLETLKSSTLRYDNNTSLVSEELSTEVNAMSALEELSFKIELCLKRQQQVRFISLEIADIIKKSS